MPADDDSARRSVVPSAAGRSLWLASIWTGVGAALVAAVVAIVAVAICWLPAAGQAGNGGSAVRAGIITFLAALRGGVTVDGLDAAFLPLGLTLAVGVICWRAGAGLADAAADLDETQPVRLVWAAVGQAFAFAAAATVLAVSSTLGTSSVPPIGAFFGGLVLFAATGGVAFVRNTSLRDDWAAAAPSWLGPAGRIAAMIAAVYLAAGALLVAGSLVVHHTQVEALSRQVGGGWSGVPVLVLGLLAAPNAAVAGAAYLAGPGFAIGGGTSVALGSSPRGVLPSFPVLGAVPHGPAGWLAWTLAVVTPIVAGLYAAALARRTERRWTAFGAGMVLLAGLGVVLAWQAGGAIGSGRLHAVGASPWQFALAVVGGAGLIGTLALGLQAVADGLRDRQHDDPEYVPLTGLRLTVTSAVSAAATTASHAATTATSAATNAMATATSAASDAAASVASAVTSVVRHGPGEADHGASGADHGPGEADHGTDEAEHGPDQFGRGPDDPKRDELAG